MSKIQSLLCYSILLTLVGCGGGTGSAKSPGKTTRFTIGGTIKGNDSSVTLSLNGVEETFSTSPFVFTNDVADGDLYSVFFVSTLANQKCVVSNSSGVVDADITNISVACSDPIVLLQYDDAEITGSLSSGDYNGDSFVDLVFSILTLPGHEFGSNQKMLRVAFGDGTGNYTNTVDVFVPGGAGVSKRGHILTSDDYNADGIDDFAISGNFLQIFAGNNTNNPSSLFIGSDYIGGPLHSADYDGNGYVDFLSILFGGSTRALFSQIRNDGTGSFASQEFVGSADAAELDLLCGGVPLNFITGDFNNDNNQDILIITISCDASGIINDSHNSVGLYTGNGNGTFDYPVGLDVLSDDIFLGRYYFEQDYKDIAAGDFDGDGDLDIAITSTTSFLQIMLNDGTGRFTANGRVTVGQAPVHVGAADFNNDGVIDLASINQDSKNVIISLGQGNGGFVSMPDAIEIKLDTDVDLYDMEIAEINNDEYPDIILVEDGTNPSGTGRGSVQIFLSPMK